MLTSHKLSLDFNAEFLKADLRQIAANEWVAHFNKGYYEGEWKGLALRSPSGRSTQLHRHPDESPLAQETAILARCAYFQEVLAAFKCPIRLARLLSLSPGSKIREHVDFFLGLEDGMLRLHIPVATDPRVEFVVDNQRLMLREGETWYIDFTLPHRVSNHSDQDRVHLVIDCTINDWLLAMIPLAGETQGSA